MPVLLWYPLTCLPSEATVTLNHSAASFLFSFKCVNHTAAHKPTCCVHCDCGPVRSVRLCLWMPRYVLPPPGKCWAGIRSPRLIWFDSLPRRIFISLTCSFSAHAAGASQRLCIHSWTRIAGNSHSCFIHSYQKHQCCLITTLAYAHVDISTLAPLGLTIIIIATVIQFRLRRINYKYCIYVT